MSAEALGNARRAVEHAAAELKIAVDMYGLGARDASPGVLQEVGIDLTKRLGSMCTQASDSIKSITANRIHNSAAEPASQDPPAEPTNFRVILTKSGTRGTFVVRPKKTGQQG